MPIQEVRFRVREIRPQCDLRDARAEPPEVVGGEIVNITFKVCNIGGGTLATNVTATFKGPTPIAPQKIPVRVDAGACRDHRFSVTIPRDARAGDYTGTLNCEGVTVPVRF